VLEVFLRYHNEQGLSPRRVSVDEMFAPETYEEFVI
jgi:4,5-dihydroxyphthalate decarboxylase